MDRNVQYIFFVYGDKCFQWESILSSAVSIFKEVHRVVE